MTFIQSKSNSIQLEILNFIQQLYPVELYPKVLEIAAGDGSFSKRLSRCGYQVTAIDPHLKVKWNAPYQQVVESFREDYDISDYDLGIAIHPCGIHSQIIKNFKLHNKSLFLIPCSRYFCDNIEIHPYEINDMWYRYLLSLDKTLNKALFLEKPNCLCEEAYNTVLYNKKAKKKEVIL